LPVVRSIKPVFANKPIGNEKSHLITPDYPLESELQFSPPYHPLEPGRCCSNKENDYEK
jgi:hypothetical protein